MNAATSSTDVASFAARIDGLDWPAITESLDASGIAATGQILTDTECAAIADYYDDDERFRSTINMARHRLGEGEYRYFSYPHPETIARLRAAFWPHLLLVARDWSTRRGETTGWPDEFGDWLEMCHAYGQPRPTPLILRYGPGDWNPLHRDLYGDLVFPLQVVVALDEPGEDYTGGEFVVVEQRARAQSRATTTTIRKGHGVVFTTRDRPVQSARGWTAAPMRHGVSTVTSGRRRTLGLVFHDAS